ncbi:O-antigen ligase family protein [bacterium]|nr:O-antigen ligase family protein [bacterium]
MLSRLTGRFSDYIRRRRELTACALLVIAYLIECVVLRLPYYYLALTVAGLILLFIVLKYPFAAYLGLVFIINLFPYAYIDSRTFTLAKIGGVFLLALTLAVMAIRTPEIKERIKRAFDRRGGVVLILILAGAISTALSRDPRLAFFERHLQFLILFALTRIYINSSKRLWWVLMVILLARGLDGIQGAYQYVTLPVGVRIGGNFTDPNEYACYSLVALPIAIYLLHLKKALWYRIGVITLGLFTFVALVVSSSRAGFITLAVLILLILFTSTIKLRNRLVALLLVVLIFFSFTPIEYWSRIESINALFEEDKELEVSLRIRKRQLYTSINLFLKHPILGVGYQQYRTTPEELLGGYFVKRGRLGEHSMFLQILVEFGLAGFIPFLILLYLAFRDGIRAAKLAKSAGDRKMQLLATAVTLSFASLVIFGVMLGTYTKYLYLYIALPMVAYDLAAEKLVRGEERREAQNEEAPDRFLA